MIELYLGTNKIDRVKSSKSSQLVQLVRRLTWVDKPSYLIAHAYLFFNATT